MKTTTRNSILIELSVSLLFLLACSNLISCGSSNSDPAPTTKTPAELATAKLVASPWKVNTVTVDGVDKTTLFTNFTITFAASSYTQTNGGPVWPSGSWSFTDANATAFSRGDGISVQLTTLTENSLVMSLTWNKKTFGPGRIESIIGQHIFTMGK
jgi:hypothetical protein